MQEEQELLRYWKPRIYKTEPVRTGKGDMDVSILIPVHNAMPYLYECLLSVLSQKRDGIRTEIILCDDHSDKETKEYMKSMKDTLASRFGRCVYTDTGERRGAAAARNACLRCASGEYVFFIDADDSLLSDIFLSELYHMAKAEDADIVYAGMRRIRRGIPETGRKRRQIRVTSDYNEFSSMPGYLIAKLIKRSLFDGLFCPEELWFEDTVTQLLLVPRCEKVVFSGIYDYGYRVNEQSLTYKKDSTPRALEAVWIQKAVLMETEETGIREERKKEWFVKFANHTGPLLWNRIRKRPKEERKAAYNYARVLVKEAERYCGVKCPKGISIAAWVLDKGNFAIWELICKAEILGGALK